MWVRGLKHFLEVAGSNPALSHPMWVRGLKQLETIERAITLVAPHVGAWIETLIILYFFQHFVVAPHVGAWIETC